MGVSMVQRYFRLNTRKKLKYFFIALLSGILIFFLFQVASVSYAQNQEPQRATFDPSRRVGNRIEIDTNAFRGNIRVYPNGRTPTRSPGEHPVLISSGNTRDQLWVAGDSQSWAHFQFWSRTEYQAPRVDPLVQAGIDRTATRYTFPCAIDGGGANVFAWGLTPVGSSVCENIVVRDSDWRSNNGNPLASKSNSQQFADASNQITVSRSAKLALIYVYNSDGNVALDVLVGAVQISTLNGLTNSVSAGNRYIHSPEGGRIEPINNLNEVVDSPSIQTFLNETNWSSDLASLLTELKSALSISYQEPQLNELHQEILNTHNQLRSEVNVPPLSWSVELAAYAQEWANQLSQENGFRHRDGGSSGAGENIAAGSSVTQMLSLWAEEKDDYDTSSATCRQDGSCLHYTQMVWRNTTEVGCGIAPHRRYGNVTVCNYRPPGNYIGQRPY